MTWINQCLNSISSQYRIVVVDNASTDGTAAHIGINFPNVILISKVKNLGFGQANNIGISYALQQGCSAVFLLNQDAYVFPQTIAKLQAFSELNNEYGILSPLHLSGDNYHLDRNFKSHLLNNIDQDFISDVYQGKLASVYDVPFVNAAAWFVPRKTLERVGGFDPIFLHYGEDDNYCQRVIFSNLHIGICPEAKVLHDRSQKKWVTPDIHHPRYYNYLERVYKVELANVNKELTQKRINGFLKVKKVAIWKSILFMRLSRLDRQRKELELLKKIVPEILESYEKNIKKGSKYLSNAKNIIPRQDG